MLLTKEEIVDIILLIGSRSGGGGGQKTLRKWSAGGPKPGPPQ